MELEGKVAIVTGAGQGLGAEIAKALAREGAKTALWDINEEAASRVAKEITGETDVESCGVFADKAPVSCRSSRNPPGRGES